MVSEQRLVGTAAVSDALDSLGLLGSLLGIRALRSSQRRVGPAYTVEYEPVDEQGGTVGDFLDEVPPGAIVVIDNQGRSDCTVWGGIMSRIAGLRGIAGTVINGTCRDVATASKAGYQIWSVSSFMRTGKDRVRVKAVQSTLTIDGVKIHPGDIVVADEDGVVAVPSERWDEVREIAENIENVEDQIVAATEDGTSLESARRIHGYHSLQSNLGKVK